MAPTPEANIRLTTVDGHVIVRRLANMAEPLVDYSGFYRTASGGFYHAATEALPANIYSSGRILHPDTVY